MRRMPCVVAEEAHREGPPPAGRSPGGMEREHVEEHHIARLELPREDLEGVPVGLDVGQLLERSLGEPLRLVVHERARHQPRATVRPGDELHGRLAVDRVDRQPHRTVLEALDVVVRLVLCHGVFCFVPGSLTSTWSWKRRTCREPMSSPAIPAAGDVRMNSLEFGDPVPVAVVLEEAPGVVRAAGDEPVARSARRGCARSHARRARSRPSRSRRERTPRRRAGTRRGYHLADAPLLDPALHPRGLLVLSRAARRALADPGGQVPAADRRLRARRCPSSRG